MTRRTEAKLMAILKAAPPKPEPTALLSLEEHQQDLADVCEETRRTTAERCAEIAGSLYAPSTAAAIRKEFGLPPGAPAPALPRLRLPRITIDPRIFEEDEESE